MNLSLVSQVDPEAPFAWNPDGNSIAYVREKLVILNLLTGDRGSIDASPSAVAWSPDGKLLGTASAEGSKTILRMYDLNGGIADETLIPGHIARLAWRPDSELLAAGLSIEKFKFGSSLRIALFRWRKGSSPQSTPLTDVTIMPARVLKYEADYRKSFSFDLSPYGDEIAYTRLIEPPNFPSYMKMVVRNLSSEAEKEAPGVKNSVSGAVYSSLGEHLLYGESTGVIKALSPWTGEERVMLASPGHALAVSPSDRYMFADGRLFLDAVKVAAFPSDCAGLFSPEGGRLLLKCGDSLSLLSGLKTFPASSAAQSESKPLLELRKWRSEGLISDHEYQTQKQRILSR